MDTAGAITLGIAILGAVTGLIGTGLSIWGVYRELDRERVKLKVVPNYAIPIGHDGQHKRHTMTIEVINLSQFPVSIENVGFEFVDTKETGYCFEAVALDHQPIQRRMEPRTSMSILYPAEFVEDPTFARIRCAFVKTACGEKVEGTSKALEHLVKKARDRRPA